jgi:hypothetical protein
MARNWVIFVFDELLNKLEKRFAIVDISAVCVLKIVESVLVSVLVLVLVVSVLVLLLVVGLLVLVLVLVSVLVLVLVPGFEPYKD